MVVKTAIIVGLNFQGLYFMRELGKRGYDLHCIARVEDEIGMFSRFGKKYIASTGKELKTVIQKITRNESEKPIAFIGSGIYLDLILKEYQEFFEMVDMLGADKDTLETLNSKIDAYRLLELAGIKVPQTYRLDEIERITFPVIVKWSTKEINDDGGIGKTRVIRDYESYIQFLASIDYDSYGNHLIAQDYVNGSKIEQWAFGAYYEAGHKVAGIFVNQKRQYPKGITCFAVEIENGLINNISGKLHAFLADIGYTGFIEFEFLVDPKIGKYYVIDVNPRPWAYIKILHKKYPNLIDYVLGDAHEIHSRNSIKPVYFARFFYDAMAVLEEYGQSKKISTITKAIKTYLDTDTVIDEFDVRDLRPIWGCVVKGIKFVFG